MEDTPIFDELRRQSGIAPAADTDQRSQLEHDDQSGHDDQFEHDDPIVGPLSDRDPPAQPSSSSTIPLKIIVAGGAGAGKTTFVSSVSEIAPLDTEAWMTEIGEGVDPTDPGSGKTTTTAAMDFGRITLHPDLVLYLFGTAEQMPSWLGGALGAAVLVDARRIEESFAAVDHFENDSDVPFIVAVNMFDGQLAYHLDDVREALTLAPEVPLTTCDARDPGSAAEVLLELVSYIKDRAVSGPDS